MRKPHDEIDRLARIDPIDGEHVAAAWSASDDKSMLFEEIITMQTTTARDNAERSVRSAPLPPVGSGPRRSGGVARWPRLVAAAVLAAVAVVGVQSLVLHPDPAYAVVERADGVLEVSVRPEFRDGDALARKLRAHGVDADVRTVPSSPSMVGQVELFGDLEIDGPPPGVSFGAEGREGAFDWTIDPVVFTGTITVEVRVAARPGERYTMAQEVFEPGEVLAGLHCAEGVPLRASMVARRLDGLGLVAEWSSVTPTDDPSITDSSIIEGTPAGEILSGYAIDDRTIRFDVLLDGTDRGDLLIRRLSDVPCTEEMAAAWD